MEQKKKWPLTNIDVSSNYDGKEKKLVIWKFLEIVVTHTCSIGRGVSESGQEKGKSNLTEGKYQQSQNESHRSGESEQGLGESVSKSVEKHHNDEIEHDSNQG